MTLGPHPNPKEPVNSYIIRQKEIETANLQPEKGEISLQFLLGSRLASGFLKVQAREAEE